MTGLLLKKSLAQAITIQRRDRHQHHLFMALGLLQEATKAVVSKRISIHLAQGLTRFPPGSRMCLNTCSPTGQKSSSLYDNFSPYLNQKRCRVIREEGCKNKKAISTKFSRAVPHLSTRNALSHLTSEFGWDPVHLT